MCGSTVVQNQEGAPQVVAMESALGNILHGSIATAAVTVVAGLALKLNFTGALKPYQIQQCNTIGAPKIIPHQHAIRLPRIARNCIHWDARQVAYTPSSQASKCSAT